MQGNELLKALRALEAQVESVRIHTWHGKETPHAALLTQLAGTYTRAAEEKGLHRFYSQVYSQHGEDGYIAEIFSRIEAKNRTFLEIGIGNGLENSTRFLLEQGWRGIWIEGNSQDAAQARLLFSKFIDNGSLVIVSEMVTTENVNRIVSEAGLGLDFDLITIDVDFNTSHLWRALEARSRVACVEYNANIPPSSPVEVIYDPYGAWDGTSYYGAGLKVMEQIGRNKAMSLVGCDLHGVNSFFVSDEEIENRFSQPFTAEHHYELPKYHLFAKIGHQPSTTAREWQTAK